MSTWGQSRVGSKGNLMERSKGPGIRTRWAAALAAGRRPRLVAAACAVMLAAPLAVVAATGTVAQARPDGSAARAAGAAGAAGTAAPTVNWALAGSASATTAESGKPAASAVDGDAGTDWCTSGYTGTLTVDLGQVRSLADLGLTLDAASPSASATIELASTAGAWQQVPALHDIALDPGNPLYFPLPSGSRARYAELTVYSDTGADVCVGEFRGYGPDAAAAGMDLGTDLSFTTQELAAGATFSNDCRPGTPVTIGNEIRNGILWPAGEINCTDCGGWDNLAQLLKAGVVGARAGNPAGHKLLVMMHYDQGGDSALSSAFYSQLTSHGVPFDVIGLSYYPFFHGAISAMRANVDALATQFRKPIVIAETQYPWTLANGNSPLGDSTGDFVWQTSQLSPGYPAAPGGQLSFITDELSIVAQVPGGLGAGLFYWAPDWIPGVPWEPGPGIGSPNVNLTLFNFEGAALPSIALFQDPAAACERSAPGSSPCVVG